MSMSRWGKLFILPSLPARNDKHIRIFLWSAGFSASGNFTPHRFRSLGSTSLSAFSASVWMVYWVHSCSAHSWTNAFPSATSSFTIIFQMMFFVTDGTDGCPTFFIYFADFCRRHFEVSVSVGIGHNLREDAGAAANLGATHRLDFNIVNKSSDRNMLKWQSIARFEFRFFRY